jgi:3-hydroxyacyl-[acyl-carrier-protein] dehydratase
MATPKQAVKRFGRGMIVPSRTFEFEFAVEPTHPALPGHFPGHPIVPGVLLLDHVLSAVTAELQRPVSVLKQVKFAAALLPGESAVVTCEACGDRLSFTVKTRRADVLVTLASGQAILAHGPTSPGACSTAARSGST